MPKNHVIPAECHSDDHIIECKFDAVAWFKQATDKAILGLAKCGWGGDYPADAVAEFMERRDADVRFMFKYIRRHNEGHQDTDGDTIGFECHVDDDKAMKWLKANKPKLHRQIAKNA